MLDFKILFWHKYKTNEQNYRILLYNLVMFVIIILIQIRIQAVSVVSDTDAFINFWLLFFDIRRETQFLKVFRNHTMLTPTPNVRPILWCLRSQFISAGRDLKNSTLRLNGRIPNSRLLGPISTLNWLFFKILKFSGPSLPSMVSSTHQPHFLPGGLLWQMVIVISFVRERKTVPNDNASELLTQIVQSPTKLNDKI